MKNGAKHLQKLKEFKEYVTQETATLQQNQATLLEMKNTVQLIGKSMGSLNNRMSEAKKKISECIPE